MGGKKNALPIATANQRKRLAKKSNPEREARKLGVRLPEASGKERAQILNSQDPQAAAKALGVKTPTSQEIHTWRTKHDPTYGSRPYVDHKGKEQSGRFKGSGRHTTANNPHLRAAKRGHY